MGKDGRLHSTVLRNGAVNNVKLMYVSTAGLAASLQQH